MDANVAASETGERREVPKDLLRILRLTALGLFLLFLFSVLPPLLALALLDPAWQLSLISALLGAAIHPLLGLALLAVAVALDGRDVRLRHDLTRLRRFALVAAVGFLLLLPVQLSAMVRLGQRSELPARAEIARLSEIRDAVAASRSQTELAAALRRLPGAPKLPAGFNRPFPAFRQEVSQTLQTSLASLEQRLGRSIQARRLGEVAVLLRAGGLLLVFAGLYAEVGGLRLLRQGRRLRDWGRRRSGRARGSSRERRRRHR